MIAFPVAAISILSILWKGATRCFTSPDPTKVGYNRMPSAREHIYKKASIGRKSS